MALGCFAGNVTTTGVVRVDSRVRKYSSRCRTLVALPLLCWPTCSARLQLKKLREAAEQSARKEAAAKAVLAAARDAAREGRSLSAEERGSVERGILNPQEEQKPKPAPPQVTKSPATFQPPQC